MNRELWKRLAKVALIFALLSAVEIKDLPVDAKIGDHAFGLMPRGKDRPMVWVWISKRWKQIQLSACWE